MKLKKSPNSPETANISARAPANRRFDASDLAEIARFCAKGLNESEAVRRIGKNPKSWFEWKSRRKRSQKFAELLEAFRADRIDSLLTKIENSADGIGLKQPDWRAAAHLLSLGDPRRFSDSGMRQAVEINVNQTTFNVIDPERLQSLIDLVKSNMQTPKAIDVEPAKQLPEETA